MINAIFMYYPIKTIFSFPDGPGRWLGSRVVVTFASPCHGVTNSVLAKESDGDSSFARVNACIAKMWAKTKSNNQSNWYGINACSS